MIVLVLSVYILYAPVDFSSQAYMPFLDGAIEQIEKVSSTPFDLTSLRILVGFEHGKYTYNMQDGIYREWIYLPGGLDLGSFYHELGHKHMFDLYDRTPAILPELDLIEAWTIFFKMYLSRIRHPQDRNVIRRTLAIWMYCYPDTAGLFSFIDQEHPKTMADVYDFMQGNGYNPSF